MVCVTFLAHAYKIINVHTHSTEFKISIYFYLEYEDMRIHKHEKKNW